MGLKLEGLDEVIREMTRMGEASGSAADAMILAGADIVRAEWIKSARKHGHVDTGAMVANVGLAGKVKTVAGMRSVDVTALGQVTRGRKTPRTTRNAEKAAYLSRGTRRIKGSRFVEEAERAADAPAAAEMTRVWTEFIETGNVPAVAGIRGKGG